MSDLTTKAESGCPVIPLPKIEMPKERPVYDETSTSNIAHAKKSAQKVAIVGFAKSWPLTPFDDPDFEVWGLNELYKFFQQKPNARADRWFEIHNPESPSKNNEVHHGFLKKFPLPIYMWKHYDEFPSSVPYPREEVKAMFNEHMIFPGSETPSKYQNVGAKYSNFSNQITWMMLLAIYEGFKEIHVYGVDMATKEELKTADGKVELVGEYIWQRPSCEAVIGFALGRGIKVLVPQQSELCKFPCDYGFDSDNSVRCFVKTRKTELINKDRMLSNQEQQIRMQLDSISRQREQLKGHLMEDSWLLGNHII